MTDLIKHHPTQCEISNEESIDVPDSLFEDTNQVGQGEPTSSGAVILGKAKQTHYLTPGLMLRRFFFHFLFFPFLFFKFPPFIF